ncbi:heterokaryon incompatibility (het-6OR allele) [Fusarium circinatum]|uniref:Heterokaryon incompatibility (Het-6OR allele) n=1 Tax=Fusarium circinatum TaxID=48490 RepID=A0A8H5TH19_FUSCI|nr:heterokaryon incompatibility (het-6OR allele) [Fusarium circinatum]
MRGSKDNDEAESSKFHFRDACSNHKAPSERGTNSFVSEMNPLVFSRGLQNNATSFSNTVFGFNSPQLMHTPRASHVPLPIFADLEQERNTDNIAFSNVTVPKAKLRPLNPPGFPAFSIQGGIGVYHCLPDRDAFRLLEILPGDGDILQCKLRVCRLSENEGSYEALSYTWGMPDASSHREIEIIANGASHSVAISGNLYIALRELRRSNNSRVVWADAICINQENVKERGHQVALMGRIFNSAWQVIIWMGEWRDRCYCGKTVLEESLSSISDAFSGICSVVNEWFAHVGQKTLKATYFGISHDDQSTVHRANSDDCGNNRSAMMQLFRRCWFSRIWVLQEAVLARNALVQLGSYQIPWEWVGLAAAIVVHKTELSPSGSGRLMIPTGAMNSYLMYRLSVSQKCLPRLEFSFAHLLQITRHFESKDPKDKIYGLLGIQTTDSITTKIVPDYRETTRLQEVYENISRLMLGTASPLTFLSGAGTLGTGFQCASGAPVEIHPDGQAGELILRGVVVDHVSSIQEHRDYWGIFDLNDKSCENFLNQPRWSKEAWTKCAMTLTCGGDGRAYPIDDEATHLADLAALVLSGSTKSIIRDLIALRDVIESQGDGMTQAEYLNEIVEGGNSDRYISAVEPIRRPYRLFKTGLKDFGVGSVDMMIGDKLCVLLGAEVPFLLRPKGDGYEVIGECYVYDLMHGEVLEKLAADPDGRLKAEWIKLI